MLESSEYSKAKIIGLGEKGKNVIDEILIDIKSLDYILINDIETISIDKENEIADFLIGSDVVIVTGVVTETSNVIHLLNCIDSIINENILPVIILGINSDKEKSLLNIISNTIFIGNYSSIIIYRTLINILISTCFPSWVSRYGAMIDASINDIKSILSYGNIHHIGFGSGIGTDGTRESILIAITNLQDDIDISKVKGILFLFRISKQISIFEIENAITIGCVRILVCSLLTKTKRGGDLLIFCVFISSC